MDRLLMEALKEWKDKPGRLPLTLLWNLPLYLKAAFTAYRSVEIAPDQENGEESG